MDPHYFGKQDQNQDSGLDPDPYSADQNGAMEGVDAHIRAVESGHFGE